MKIKRRGERLIVTLRGTETRVLTGALDALDAALTDLPVEDPVWKRLHPDAAADAGTAGELHELLDADLDTERRSRLGACRRDLAAGSGMELDPEGAERWLTVLNDLRLSLGTRLNITAEDSGRLNPFAPDADQRGIYLWLTAFQSRLVDAVMGG